MTSIGRDDHGAAGLLDLLRCLLGVRDGDVGRPCRGLALLHVAHQAGDVLAVALEHAVAAGLRGRPARSRPSRGRRDRRLRRRRGPARTVRPRTGFQVRSRAWLLLWERARDDAATEQTRGCCEIHRSFPWHRAASIRRATAPVRPDRSDCEQPVLSDGRWAWSGSTSSSWAPASRAARSAAPLARAGRRVLVLDRMRFPSDQLSTHVLMPAGTSELAKMGALPRILAPEPVAGPLGPRRGRRRSLPRARAPGRRRDRLRRLRAARPAGRRSSSRPCASRAPRSASAARWRRCAGAPAASRACATATARATSSEVACHARRRRRRPPLDRRRRWSAPGGPTASRATAAASCSATSRTRSRARVEAETYYQWREGDSFAFAFPTTPAGRLLVLLMGHRDEVERGAPRPRGLLAAQARTSIPASPPRVAGAPPGSKLRSTGETPAFFRASSGPGWALAGDAGHFKDPVTGQGMRDAMFAGRTLAEQVLPVLDDPAAVDRATRALGGRARPRVPARLPLRQRRHARRAPVPGAAASSSAMPGARRRRTSPTCSAAPARRSRSRRCRASRGRSSRRSGAGERPRSETLPRAARGPAHGARDPRASCAPSASAPPARCAGSEHPGAAWPEPPPRPSGAAPAAAGGRVI